MRRCTVLGLLASLVLAGAFGQAGDAFARTRSHAAAKSQGRAAAVASAIVVDMNSGRVLYTQAPDAPRHPASLTKMMTLYVLFSYLRSGAVTLDSALVVTPHAAAQSPTKLGLKPGATITVADAIKGLVTQSANDAAVTVAENIGGTEENFAKMMTQKAHALGMSGTFFRNASGLPDPDQITTARDMAILAQHLMYDFPEYYSVFQTRYFVYQGHRYRNHNHLLFTYKGTDGVKTGYTQASGFNLTASVHRDGKHLVAVVLGGKTSAQRDGAMRMLLDRYFPQASPSPSGRMLIAGAGASAPKPAPSQPAIVAPQVAAAAPAPAPKARKPILAGMVPSPVATPASSPAAASPVQPASYGSQSGDAADVSAEAIPASLPAVEADPIVTGRAGVTGAYHVQVGAFPSETAAQDRLTQVQQAAGKVVQGHLPFTTSFQKGSAEWYRARFAGFSQDQAKSACAALKRLSLECAVMRAE